MLHLTPLLLNEQGLAPIQANLTVRLKGPTCILKGIALEDYLDFLCHNGTPLPGSQAIWAFPICSLYFIR